MTSRKQGAALAGILLGMTSTLACSNPRTTGSGPENNSAFGGVGMELQLAAGVTVNVVNWSISTTDAGFSRSGTVNVQLFSDTVKFQVGGLPAGEDLQLSVTATSVDGTITCTGATGVSVVAGATTAVNLSLICVGASADAGTIVVTGSTEVCANITSLSVFPLESTVDGPVTLAATASVGSVTPTFTWTASAGTFNDPASATPTFTCPSTPQSVNLTVSVAPAGPGCPTTTAQSVTVECGTLNPTFTNVYANVISQRCISCHRPGGSGVTVGQLDMITAAGAFANLVGVSATGTGAGTSGLTCASLDPLAIRVIPGDAINSVFYDKIVTKLAGTLSRCGSPMPLGNAAPLRAGQIALVEEWISAGAQNN